MPRDYKKEADFLIKKYKSIVKDDLSEPSAVADLFLAIVIASLETMGPDPKTAANLL